MYAKLQVVLRLQVSFQACLIVELQQHHHHRRHVCLFSNSQRLYTLLDLCAVEVLVKIVGGLPSVAVGAAVACGSVVCGFRWMRQKTKLSQL